MPDFRDGSASDFLDLAWSEAARGGWNRYSNRFDVNQTLICFAAVRFDTYFDTIFIFLWYVNFRLQ